MRQVVEEEMNRLGLKIRPAIQVQGREAARKAVVVGIGLGVIPAAGLGADSRVIALPILDCARRMSETLVRLPEPSSRPVVATFLDRAMGRSGRMDNCSRTACRRKRS